MYVAGLRNSPWRKRILQSTRGQILGLLRTGDRTVDELATKLRLTDNAVRAHLISLERDGFVAPVGRRAGIRAGTVGSPHRLPRLRNDVMDL